jgi:superfamily II DNA or RNA helicase
MMAKIEKFNLIDQRSAFNFIKQRNYTIVNSSSTQFTVSFNSDKSCAVINVAEGYYPKGFCDCRDFSSFRKCMHMASSLIIASKFFQRQLHFSESEFYPRKSREDVIQHDLLFILKKADKGDDVFSLLPTQGKKSQDLDQIYYEYHPSYSNYERIPFILFYSISRPTKSNKVKFKEKKIKFQDLDSITDGVDKKILPKLLEKPILYERYFRSPTGVINGAKLTDETSLALHDLIKSNRFFLKTNSLEEANKAEYLNRIAEESVELKLKVDSSDFRLSIAYYLGDHEISSKNKADFFIDSGLCFFNSQFYKLINHIPHDLVSFFGEDESLKLTKEQFEGIRDEVLLRLNHRSIAGDQFNLPVVNVESPSVVHIRLPLTDGAFFWATLKEETQPLEAPFNHLTHFFDKHRAVYENFIFTEMGISFEANGYFKIPINAFNQFLEGAERISLKIIADRAVIKNFSKFNLTLTHDMNWFEVNGSAMIGDVEMPLPEILKKLKVKEQFIELKDGSKAFVPQKWMEKVARLTEAAEFVDGKYVVHESRALQLESLEVENVDLSKLVHRIKSFKSLPEVSVSKTFKGKLREYQSFSLVWMKFLRGMGLGGCLADDMGLGKTVQVAANLAIRNTEKDFDGSPHIIVCPKSLIFNWKNELKRFTPHLKVELVESGKIDIKELMKSSGPDIIITTFGILQRNCENFLDTYFDYIVLDEAQAIKNPRSLTAKASFTLKGRHRLVLTGTPVENHVGELYSLFNFLMPGAYKKLALNPDLSSKSTILALRPFILRRTKAQVLTDLPEKVEQIVMCEQLDEERAHYVELKNFISSNINKELELGDFKKSSFVVLEALTRLRQAACHPGLVNPVMKTLDAGKISILKEMLSEILEEGHKVIIFSQFTSLLRLAREKLNLTDENSCYLDGKSVNREKIVQEFQESTGKNVFFVSLKAGGTGLNLTEASYCFILDPWWNPAVESQAIGRLHRMGQKKSVNVYRLISKDTIEEKVLELQNIKSDIIKDTVSDENEGFIRNLNSTDLQYLLS